MRVFATTILACAVSAVSACSAPNPDPDATAYRGETTTGSNIPRKGQAETVDRGSYIDTIKSGGGPRTGGNGG